MATFQSRPDKQNGGIKAFAVTSIVNNGERTRQWLYLGTFPSERVAKREFNRVSGNLNREKVIEITNDRINAKETPTLSETVPLYLKAEDGINLNSVQGMKRYEIALGHIVKIFGDLKLHELTPKIIREYIRLRKSQKTYKGIPPSYKTIFNEISQLSSLCGWALQEELIQVHPFRNAQNELKEYFGKKGKALQAETKPKVVLTEEEQTVFLKAAEDQPYAYAIAIMLLYSGMRVGELAKVKLSDVNLSRKELMVKADKTKDHRILPLYGPLLDLLPKLMTHRPLYSNWEPRNAKTNEFLLCKNTGERYKTIGKDLYPNICENAGIIKHVTNHVFRHTLISNMRAEGFSSYEIMTITGHKNVKTLEGYGVNAPRGLGARMESAFPRSKTDAQKVDEKVDSRIIQLKTLNKIG